MMFIIQCPGCGAKTSLCALRYELAKAEGDVRSIGDFVVTE